MGDFSKKAMLRFALLKQRIPFDDLKPRSSIEFGGSTSKSLPELIMYDNGISVEDLKKGTFYENLEINGEDIEKMRDEAAALEKDNEMYGGIKNETYYEMAMEKDKEMFGDLDNIVKKTKKMKKIERIEKKKIVKHYGHQEKRT